MPHPSIAMAYYLESMGKEQTSSEFIALLDGSVKCGNGIVGSGFPGERQVNDPAHDPPLFPHITQSETSIARHGTYILFGFNDSNGINTVTPSLSNISGFAFSSDSGVTWSDCGDLPKGTFRELGGDPVIAADSNGIFYYGSLATDNTGTSVISVSTGVVKFPVIDGEGNIYVFYEFFAPNIPNLSNPSTRLVKSTDGGITFNTGNSIIVAYPVTAAATSTEDCNGSTSILVEEMPQLPPLPILRRSIRTNEFPHAAVAPDGTLYVVWNDGKNLATTGIDIYLAYSTEYCGLKFWDSYLIFNIYYIK